MPKISLKLFKGLYPSIAARLLPEGVSQVAIDCDLSSGSAKPFRGKVSSADPASSNKVNTIYFYTDKNVVKKWLSWDDIVNVVRAPIAPKNDPLISRLYYSGDGVPKVTDTDQLLQSTPYFQLGVPAPSTAPAVTIVSAGTNPTSRIYVVTHVTAWGEESAPSLVSDIVDVDNDGEVDLASIPQSPNNTDHNPVTKIYIYRSVSGTKKTSFQFVDEVAHGVTAYNDTKTDTELDELISTLDGNEPPAGLFGLMGMQNGVMVGFNDYEVCFSEPYQPHSWPDKYKLTSRDKIIGGGVFGNRITVVTDSKPFVVTGTHPDSMTVVPIEEILPCVSVKGIVSMGGGVIFPTPEGLHYIGSGGPRSLTKGLYTEEDWKLLKPEEFSATQWSGKYAAFTSEKGYLFDLANPDQHTHISSNASAVHSDTDNKHLYFNQFTGSSNKISRFHASQYYDVLTWRSKEFFYPDKIAFSAGQVFTSGEGVSSGDLLAAQALFDAIALANAVVYNSGSLGGAVNSNAINAQTINGSSMRDLPEVPADNVVSVRFYANGELVIDMDVSDKEIFRMPIDGFSANEFEVELSSPLVIDEANFATSIRDLML